MKREQRTTKEKLEEFKDQQKKAEELKNQVALFIHEMNRTIEDIKSHAVRLDTFRSAFSAQGNLLNRLDLTERSISMLVNQLQNLSPKIYMVEDPVYPVK